METRFEALLQSEDRHIEKLKELVFDAINEEELLSEKLYEF
jgi:hypothetical protein